MGGVEGKLPGLRGAQHIGIAVPDLEQAVAFFERVIGARTLIRCGAVEADGAWMRGSLGAHEDSRLAGLAVLRCGHGTNVELLEYRQPGGLGPVPDASANATSHLALEVDDIDAAATFLRAQGLELLDGPNEVREGDFGGLRWLYFRSPWGLTLELVSAPEGLGYARATSDRLWDPKAPAA